MSSCFIQESYVELLHPRVVNLLDALGANAVHLAEPLTVLLDDVESVHAELGDDELGELWTDTLDESAAEVFLQSEERGRHGFLIGHNNELATVLPVNLPLPVGDKHGAYGHIEHVADQGDEVVIPLHPRNFIMMLQKYGNYWAYGRNIASLSLNTLYYICH